MPTITTYQLTPHSAAGQKQPVFYSLYLRELVNYLVRESWDELEMQGLMPNLFFNRDVNTGRTQIVYPLVIYHFIEGRFYLTGINAGAKAVDFIAAKYTAPFEYKNTLYAGFKPFKNETFNDECSDKEHSYVLHKWIPVHHNKNTQFKRLSLIDKVGAMQQQLEKHIKQEFCKYLELEAENINAEIAEIRKKHPEPFLYKGYKFRAYDIEFTSNLLLPEFICLGNNKALGFGRVSKE